MPLTKVVSSMLASGASGSGGSTGKNYISTYNNNNCNGDFESGSISGWNLCTVGGITNGVPTTSLALSATGVTTAITAAGSQIAGQYSLNTSFSTSSQYQGFISDPFTIDAEDLAKVLTFKFYYQVTSGGSSTVSNFSGTSSNTFLIAIFDATVGTLAAPVWIQPAGVYSMTQSSGAGIATGTFQTSATSTQYRFAVICANNPVSSSVTVTFDDFTVGPQTAPIGPVVTDWVSYTPALPPSDGLTAFTSSDFWWRRVGGDVEIRGRFVPTATNGNEARIALPSGLVASSSPTIGSPLQLVGTFQSGDVGVVGQGVGISASVLIEPSKNYVVFSTRSTGNSGLTKIVGSSLLSAGNSFALQAKIPIAGWSSNVQTSNDTDTRVVAAQFGGDAASVGANNIIVFPTVKYDTHGAYNSSTGTYTVPVSGFYKVTGFFNGSASLMYISVYKGVTSYADLGYINAAGTVTLAGTVQCNAGDTLTIRPSATYDAAANCNVQIERLSGPSVIAATETVACTYTGTATGTLTTGGTNFLATVPTKIFDTHNCYSSGLFTVPVSGKYQVTAQLQINATYVGGITTTRCEIRQAGSASTSIIGLQGWPSGASNYPTRPNTSIILNCIAGDTIGIYGGSDGSSNSYGNQCSVSIVRVGN